MAHSNHADNYLTKTLMCKNNCGYYGNSIQYDGYCSICYRKLKSRSAKHHDAADPTSHSLLATSQSFNNHFSLDERSDQQARIKSGKTWNDHSNLNKFHKKEQRKTSTNAFKQFLRRPSSQSIVETVSKVADKAVNMVDQSLGGSSIINEGGSLLPASLSSSFSSIASLNSYLGNSDASLADFNACLNKLVTSPSTASTTASAATFTSDNDSRQILADFEHQFRAHFPQLYQDLAKQMRQFVDRFVEAVKRNEPQVDTSSRQNEVVQEFFKKIHKYVLGSASIRAYAERAQSLLAEPEGEMGKQACEEAEKLHEAVMIMVESYVTRNVYDCVFPAIMGEFEEQDMQLQKRIRDFYWVTNDMIGTCIDENSIFYRDSYEEALNYIVEMDSKRSAHEKMLCITECSKNIYKAINISATISRDIDQVTSTPTATTKSPQAKSVASADDYLPAFIYIVLKANPTMLYSNMNFISRFAFEKRILQGEHAYHFCSLNAIINHIEHLSARHLNMTEEKFESYCSGLEDSGTSNALKLVQSNLKIIAELGNKQKLLHQDTNRLQAEMDQFKRLMDAKFNACLDKNKLAYTTNIAGYERRSVLDLENEACLLPKPLMPSSTVN